MVTVAGTYKHRPAGRWLRCPPVTTPSSSCSPGFSLGVWQGCCSHQMWLLLLLLLLLVPRPLERDPPHLGLLGQRLLHYAESWLLELQPGHRSPWLRLLPRLPAALAAGWGPRP
jgi:hypothetical protein